jgi:hypothetical protein
MEFFVLACLSACVFFFLISACVNIINIEKKIKDTVDITEDAVVKLYNGE